MYTIKKFSAKKTKIACNIVEPSYAQSNTRSFSQLSQVSFLQANIFCVIEFILFVITKLFTIKLCCSSPLYNVRFFTFSWAWRLLSYDENFELLWWKGSFLLELAFLPIIYHHDWDCFRKVWALGFTLKIE